MNEFLFYGKIDCTIGYVVNGKYLVLSFESCYERFEVWNVVRVVTRGLKFGMYSVSRVCSKVLWLARLNFVCEQRNLVVNAVADQMPVKSHQMAKICGKVNFNL